MLSMLIMNNCELGQQLIQRTIQSLERCVKIMDSMKTIKEVPLSKNEAKIMTKCVEKVVSNNSKTIDDNVQQKEVSPSDSSKIVIEPFRDETQMADIMRVITNDLSEPYSIYTYRYFIQKWPQLCLLARETAKNEYIGVIVCKMDMEPVTLGYIAMLAVDASSRRRGIGSQLVREAIAAMCRLNCVEISLETEVTNENALKLYSGLGFIREKRLFRYYLNGVDAFRLKLPLMPSSRPSETATAAPQDDVMEWTKCNA